MFWQSREQARYERKRESGEQAGSQTGCIFVVLLLALGGWNLYQFALMWASSDWQKTTGVVVLSQSAPGTLVTSLAYADVEYSYIVQGKPYKSANLHWGSAYRLTLAAATQEAARYPRGAKVEVYYDPNAPADAVLEPGFNRHFVFDILLSLLAVGLGFMLVNVLLERAAKKRMRYDSS